MTKTLSLKRFHLGACYYPEQWDKSLWTDDLRRMKEMGFSIIRIGEFAWSIFEPEEGKFEFTMFDDFLEQAAISGIKVIMGTPTATPPAWLTHKYPEVLNVSMEGVTYQHGQRRHYNYSSPVYLELCERITRKMAQHYKDHPAIVGWQIDNEFNCEINVFYSEADHLAFRQWLQKKYDTLEQLNSAWGTVFWNQTYTSWEQVYLTRPTVSGSPNPHQALDEKRFISDNTISFAKLQADILRTEAPNHWVTTNGVFGHLDSHQMTDDLLDFFSYDSYPQFSTIYPDLGDKPLLDRKWSLSLSNVRSMSPNFCVMEQQSGPGGWVNKMEMPSPLPGQMRLWTYQSIAHGADMILYFRWRTATFGTEIYWHGINDYHNQPNRRVAEASHIGQELQKVGQRIVGKHNVAEVALVRDYDNEWDGELDQWHGPLTKQSELSWYKALQYGHIPVDIFMIRPGMESEQQSELSKYKVLIYPHPAILRDSTAAMLQKYVEGGGIVIFGCRTGYKNEFGHCRMQPLPGPVAEMCGIHVEDFTMVNGTASPVSVKFTDQDIDFTAPNFNDILRVQSDTVEVLAHYSSSYYDGKPALTVNRIGKGLVYYWGAAFDLALASELIGRLPVKSPLAGWCQAPSTVEVAVRADAEEELVFLLNYSGEPAEIILSAEAEELLSGSKQTGAIQTEPYGVWILKKEK
ncbi:beta-galactosidase [Paenibacillus gallinarum]|uniref:Beta-galactosidase n=1 Tax=Paenibacillus gallinarum TaxID=2762232 RepID=A0ABR8T132_9BACL|nr:beta-galactosidase [Paenibacillus gallinarum]MBD7969461.1 beta-galactosidase [Paenibacillus gallinarum]